MESDVIIRPIAKSDRARWEPLWTGYTTFYEKTVSADVTDFTWDRLSRHTDLFAFLAIGGGGEGIGLVQYLFHSSSWNKGGNCYLQDLFVVPSARGRHIGRRLIAAVADAAKAEGAAVLYWQTEEFNGTARRLYERVAKRSPFIRYDIDL